MTLGQGLALSVIGSLVGIAGALSLTRFLSGYLYGSVNRSCDIHLRHAPRYGCLDTGLPCPGQTRGANGPAGGVEARVNGSPRFKGSPRSPT